MAAAKPSKATSRKKPARSALSPARARLFLAITLALPLLILAALEVGLRLGNYGGDTSAFTTPQIYQGRYKAPSERLGKRYFPQERLPPSPPQDAFLADKPAHSMRIFVLGESSAAGFPYQANGTFSAVLRDVLTDVLPSDTVEVINMGMAATNSYTIVDLAGDVIDQQPDAVLIYGGHNEYYGALGAGSTETLGSMPGLVRFYLRLQQFRTFLLLRNFAAALTSSISGGRSTADIEADATRMESLVGNQRITLGGDAYRRGVRQYESNLRIAIERLRKAGIPVFVGSTPSNLRDQRPFGTAAVPPDSAATRVYDSAGTALASGDSARAHAMFARARDLDVIRFRAPGEFQSVVQRVARQTGAVYVPAAELVARASRHGIPGADLFFEHVHPNQTGYLHLARAYYQAIASAGFVGRKADLSRFAGWSEYQRRMSLTELDHRIAHHTIQTVTTRWPFLPVARQLDYRGTYRPADFVDSVAFAASRGGLPWAQAKVLVAQRHAASAEIDRAVAEFDGLIRDRPQIEIAYSMAARALLSASQLPRARQYLQRAHSISPTGFNSFSLGVIELQEKNLQRGIALLQQSLVLSPDTPSALYQLSLAYAMDRNLQGARSAAGRLAQVAPTYPGLSELLSTLGMSGQ